jgi:DNA mismatch repair protein MSH4
VIFSVSVTVADTSIAKNVLNMQSQKCFAVRSGINGLLDVARRQYTEIIEEMHEAVSKYKEKTGITSLKLQHNARRGYYLSFDVKTILSPDTRKLFIQINHQSKRTICSTEELNSINQKIKDVLDEIFLLTDTVVDDLLSTIRRSLNVLFKASESIALFDMLFSFATLVTISGDYVRPEFTSDGPIAIKCGKHPILERTKGNFVAVSTIYPDE